MKEFISVSLDSDTLKKIKEIKTATGVPVSYTINKILNEHFNQGKKREVIIK